MIDLDENFKRKKIKLKRVHALTPKSISPLRSSFLPKNAKLTWQPEIYMYEINTFLF
jgi:hypothetical protein